MYNYYSYYPCPVFNILLKENMVNHAWGGMVYFFFLNA